MAAKTYKNGIVTALALMLAMTFAGCARFSDSIGPSSDFVFIPSSDSAADELSATLAQFAPAVVVEDDWASWNRPGTAIISRDHVGRDRVTVDPTRATVYGESRSFVSAGGRSLTNHIYRMHFDRVPVSYVPFHITAGPNGGIMVVVTVDDQQTPLLYTLVHSCGCYIAFIPTTALPSDLRPPGWPTDTQTVFDIELPAEIEATGDRVLLRVARGEHRMIGLEPLGLGHDWSLQSLHLRPTSGLESLPDADGGTQSFYINEGRARGWVRDTKKPFEKLFISWWSLDPRVGVDKRYGQPGDDAPSFYTSLKPWERQASDMRYFDRFLTYWGWRL